MLIWFYEKTEQLPRGHISIGILLDTEFLIDTKNKRRIKNIFKRKLDLGVN